MEKNHLRSLQQAHDEAFSKAGSVRLPGEQDGNEHTARGTRRRERGENRQRESNPLDLRRFVKENHADGRIQGRRYWLLPDGKAVLERADGDPENYYESDEAVLRHGERVDFELDGEPKETLYWDAKARQFSELDPLRDTPIIKGERAEPDPADAESIATPPEPAPPAPDPVIEERRIYHPSEFKLQLVSGAYTGIDDGEGLEHYFTHPEFPGRRINKTEFEQMIGEEVGDRPIEGIAGQPPAPPEAPPGAPPGGPIDPSRIFGDAPVGPGGTGQPGFEIDPRRYEGLTVKNIREVLANERDSQYFGEVLRAINPDTGADVLGRYMNGTQTPKDMDFMTYVAHEYALRLKLGEDTMAFMAPEEIELLSRRNKDFLNILTHEGPERASELVKASVMHIAMKDPDSVEDMRDTMEALKKDRETYRFRQSEGKIDALCSKYNIAKKDFGAVFDLGSREGRQESKDHLTERIHKRAGAFRRAIDWASSYAGTLPGSSRHAAIRAMMKAEKALPEAGPTSWVLRRVDESLESIAQFLGSEIRDPEMRSLVAQEVLRNENVRAASESGPRTFAQAQELIKNRHSEASLKQRIEQRIQADPNWATRSQFEQNGMMRNWRREEAREQSGGGFWSWFFDVLFGQNFNKAASAAIGRPVYA